MKHIGSYIILSIVFIGSSFGGAQDKFGKDKTPQLLSNDPCGAFLPIESCGMALYHGKVIGVINGHIVEIILKKGPLIKQSNSKLKKSERGEKS
ncbi:MAG TPA: hypothetical protein VEF04_18050 [Blastocatellia bacterium]|nr:hypothetical protein [Blastocatellia bacterium]